MVRLNCPRNYSPTKMRPTHVLSQVAKKKVPVPVEMYPLFAACGVAIVSAGFFTYRHFAHNKELRLWQNANLSNLDDVLNEHKDE